MNILHNRFVSEVYFTTTLLLCLNHDSFHDHGVIIFQTVSSMHLNNRMVSFGMPSELTTLQIKSKFSRIALFRVTRWQQDFKRTHFDELDVVIAIALQTIFSLFRSNLWQLHRLGCSISIQKSC